MGRYRVGKRIKAEKKYLSKNIECIINEHLNKFEASKKGISERQVELILEKAKKARN